MSVPPVKIIIGLRHWMNRAPVRVVRGDDALDGGEAIIKPAGGFMQIVEQALVLCGEGGSGLPARDIMEDQPWQPDEEHAYDHDGDRQEEHTSELQSLMRNSYPVFCLKNNKKP